MLAHTEEWPASAEQGSAVAVLACRIAAEFKRGIYALGELDARSLAFFRMMLGGLIVLDIALRLIDLRAFYTDFGVLPRSVVIERHNPVAHFSFLMSSGAAWFQAVVLLLTAGSGVCLAVGYRTRIAAIASWVLLVSIQYRNPLILQGGDVLFRILVLFAMALPVSNVWSLDARCRRAASLRPSLLNFAYVAQVACVYIVTGLAKYKYDDWRDGFGLAYSFWLQQYTTWLGDWMGALPLSVLQWMNTGVLATEIILPLIILLPWRVVQMRAICIMTMIAFHIAILLTLKVGLFSLISMIAWLPLLPASFWEVLSSKFRGARFGSFFEAKIAPLSAAVPRWRYACIQALGGVLLSFLIIWNGTNIFSAQRVSLRPPWMTQVALFFGVDQSWEMFSRPITSDGWFMIPAVRADGSMVDLFSGKEYSAPERPASVSASFLGDRWRKYWRNLLAKDRDYQRLGLGRYLCRRGMQDSDPQRRIEALQIIFIQEPIKRDGAHAASEKILLWNHECKSGLMKKWEKTLPFAGLPFPKAV